MTLLRYLWAAPVTLLGLLLTLFARASGGRSRLVSGVIETEGGLLAWLLPRIGIGMTPAAITLGHVVLAIDADVLHRTREHERVHVRQTEQWGILFPVAYLVASLIALVGGRDPYRDNRFEREARGGR